MDKEQILEKKNKCLCIVCQMGLNWSNTPEEINEAIKNYTPRLEREWVSREDALKHWPEN